MMRSLDDLSLNSTSNKTQEPRPRARSTSPVKKRQSLPPNFYKMGMGMEASRSLDDMKSINSWNTRTLPLDKLKLLSKSPMSRRLYVTTSSETDKHIIPIPFVLQMPPRLSKRIENGTPGQFKRKKCKKPARLVYIGDKYEKLDSSSESEEESITEVDKLGVPPRPTVANVESSQITFQTNHLSNEELSIIEEVSNIDVNSRQASMKSAFGQPTRAPMPPMPPMPPVTMPMPMQQKGIDTPNSIQPIAEPPRSGRFVYGDPNQMHTNSHTQPTPQQAYMNVRFVSSPTLGANQPQIDETLDEDSEIDVRHNRLPNTFTIGNFGDLYGRKLQSWNVGGQLRLEKRTFSDESGVSSVSSFSSVGDLLRTSEQRDAMDDTGDDPSDLGLEETLESDNTITHEESQRIVSRSSTLSDKTVGSNGSWNSLQRSVDISYQNDGETLKESLENEAVGTEANYKFLNEKVLPPIPGDIMDEDSRNEEAELIDIYENTEMSVAVSQESGSMDEITYTEETVEVTSGTTEEEHDVTLGSEQVEDEEEVSGVLNVKAGENSNMSSDSENNGLGKCFSFPNTEENITNQKIYLDNDQDTFSKSRVALPITKDGHIEIPDLNNTDSELYSLGRSVCSFKGTMDDIGSVISQSVVEDDVEASSDTKLEPIGIPSEEAKRAMQERFNELSIGEEDSESEMESVKGSLYSSFSKSKSAPCLALKKNSPLPPIPVEKDKTVSTQRPVRKHVRHKSLFDINFEDDLNTVSNGKSLSHNSIFALQTDDLQKPAENTTVPNTPKIVVEEPPSQVSYEVDFKEAAKMESCLRNEPDQFAKIRENYIKQLGERKQTESRSSPVNKGTATLRPFIAAVDDLSSISSSSYQSSRSAKATTATSLTEHDNVMIDLTKDDYDVCMIQRNNSTHSYVSVTEKNREGKEVEVILVDDENERDELASIYSKYRGFNLSRSNSRLSDASYASSASYSSNVPSESQLRVKPVNESLVNKYKEMNNIRGNFATQQKQPCRSNTSSTNSTSYNSRRIKHPKSIPMNTKNFGIDHAKRDLNPTSGIPSKYFEYSNNPNYDFSSYMKSQSANKIFK